MSQRRTVTAARLLWLLPVAGLVCCRPGPTSTGDDDDDDDDTDELSGCLETAWVPDLDDDGFGGAESEWVWSCAPPFGHVRNARDCDDRDALRWPGAEERCNGIDDDCDGVVDNGLTPGLFLFRDADGDGFGDPETPWFSCLAEREVGWVENSRDCDDSQALRRPDMEDLCDGLDNDCDGEIDEGDFFVDQDGDGYGSGEARPCEVGQSLVPAEGDCDEADTGLNPGRPDWCEDGIDQDCQEGDAVCTERVSLADVASSVISEARPGGDGGYAIQAMGDLNGDGFDDLAIASPWEIVEVLGDALFRQDGWVFLAFGPFGPWTDLRSLPYVYSRSGPGGPSSLAAGDLNNDGVTDLAWWVDCASHAYECGDFDLGKGLDWGRAEVLFGPFSEDEARGYEADFVLTGITMPWIDVAMRGEVAVGDVSGDGIDDLVLAVDDYGDGGIAFENGQAWVQHGPLKSEIVDQSLANHRIYAEQGSLGVDGVAVARGGLGLHTTQADWGIRLFGQELQEDHFVLWSEASIRPSGELGYTMGHTMTWCDLNGDGVADLIAGDYYEGTEAFHSGAVFVFNGPVEGNLTAEDADAVIHGRRDENLGWALGCAGDLDRDGFEDLAIGPWAHDEGDVLVELFYGPISGVRDGRTADRVFTAPVDVWDYTTLESAGDVNGDGFDDLAVGFGEPAGVVYLLHGSPR